MNNLERPSQLPGREIPPDKIKRHFGHSFEVSNFEDGDRVPVGGASVFSGEANTKVIGDFANFNDFFGRIHESAEKYDKEQLRGWLISAGIPVDEKVFATLFAFTKNLPENYTVGPDNADTRRDLYAAHGMDVKLSDVMRSGGAECAEIAALAQAYLQKENIPSSYFSGAILRKKGEEFAEAHSFIVVHSDSGAYIYDPANPTLTDRGAFPSIYTTDADFDKEMSGDEKRFVTSKNVIDKSESFYGVDDGTNVDWDKEVV